MQHLRSFKVWFRGFLFFLGLVALDYALKKWALGLSGDINYGFFGINLSHLQFSDPNQKSLILRIIHYTTFLGPLMLLYFFFSFQFLTIDRSRKLNYFLAIWMAGIVGNILDRIIYGRVIDYFHLHLGIDLFFNLASLMTFGGAIAFIIFIVRNKEDYIFANKRKLRLLYADLQYDYVGKILFVCLFLCLTLSIFSYTFIKFYLAEYGMNIDTSILNLYLIQVTIISVLYLVIIVLVGFHFSNRFVGPLHGFEKFIERLEAGDANASFKLRENDYHQNLEVLAEKIKTHWKN